MPQHARTSARGHAGAPVQRFIAAGPERVYQGAEKVTSAFTISQPVVVGSGCCPNIREPIVKAEEFFSSLLYWPKHAAKGIPLRATLILARRPGLGRYR